MFLTVNHWFYFSDGDNEEEAETVRVEQVCNTSCIPPCLLLSIRTSFIYFYVLLLNISALKSENTQCILAV